MKKILSILLALLIFSCQKEIKNNQEELLFADETESYKIINIAFKDHFSKHRNYTKTKFSETTILTYKISPFFLMNDCITKNHTLKNEKINLKKIDKIEFGKLIDYIPCKDSLYLENCSEKFLGNFAFSKVMINKRRDKAIVNINFRCGGKCGDETTYYLKKTNGKWNLKNEKIIIEY